MEITTHLDIHGMYCAACATRIEKAVHKIDGVTKINVNLTTEKGLVTFNQSRTSLPDIITKINKIGFEAKPISKNKTNASHDKQRDMKILQWKFIFSALFTIPLAWSMFAHFNWANFMYIPALFTHPLFQFIITIPIQFVIGFSFYERAWGALKNGSANMDVLVVLSTSAAFFYSHYLTFTSFPFTNQSHTIVLYYETSAFIITFILLGKLLEAKTKAKTTEAIKKLYHLQTKTATVYRNNQARQTPVADIILGDIIMLKPGDKVPIDGKIVQGSSNINESLLTGESIPVDKKYGDTVYAGTINQNNVLKIEVTKLDTDTVLSHIIRVVEEAQASKAPIQQIADKITGVFVPIIILIALTTFFAWYSFLQPGHVEAALEKGIAVLIIACPCALGLATPTSVMVGSGRAAQLGILFKEGKFIELLGRCKMIILDKTGTLTKGFPQVTNIYVERMSENTFWQIVGAVEKDSNHPIAQAILQEAKTITEYFPVAKNVSNIPGYGVKASVNGRDVIIASPNFFMTTAFFLSKKTKQFIAESEKEGKTVIITSIDGHFAGALAVADEIKSSSIAAVSRLKQMELEIVMLTGDNKQASMAVAKKIGINKVQAEVIPQEKAKIIKQLQQKGNKVMMVGDGMNDAPALAVANVGVAMGTGSDIAIESGDVTIIKGNLERLVDAITISKKTMTNIKQNLTWAFLYNIIMIPFAMLGYMAPWLAGAAMAFSSVSVVLNALRLRRG